MLKKKGKGYKGIWRQVSVGGNGKGRNGWKDGKKWMGGMKNWKKIKDIENWLNCKVAKMWKRRKMEKITLGKCKRCVGMEM